MVWTSAQEDSEYMGRKMLRLELPGNRRLRGRPKRRCMNERT